MCRSASADAAALFLTIWRRQVADREWRTLHRKQHVAKYKLVGNYVYAMCGVIGKPSMLVKAIGRCSACELVARIERSRNKDLAVAA